MVAKSKVWVIFSGRVADPKSPSVVTNKVGKLCVALDKDTPPPTVENIEKFTGMKGVEILETMVVGAVKEVNQKRQSVEGASGWELEGTAELSMIVEGQPGKKD